MGHDPATWACVATTTAPRRPVEWFVAHHLEMGASEVVVFFDDPLDATALILRDVPGLRVVECDTAYWQARGQGRPDSLRQRSTFNANHAANSLSAAEWIVQLDIDSYLCPADGLTVGAVLGQVSADVPAVRIGGGFARRRGDCGARFSGTGVRKVNDAPVPPLTGVAAIALDASGPGQPLAPSVAHLTDAVARRVAPRRRPDSSFAHVSDLRAPGVPDTRFFQIGMNRAGSKEICAHFGRRGYSYAHWGGGKIARDLHRAVQKGKPPFRDMAATNLISDIEVNGADLCFEGFYEVDHLARHFPDAIYILNHRPVDDWIRSRAAFRGGRYLETHRQFFGLPDAQAVRDKWAADWAAHLLRVRHLASQGLRVIDWPIYTRHPAAFFAELSDLIAG